jgi:hypothetical protein
LNDFPTDGRRLSVQLVLVVDHSIDDENGERVGRRGKRESWRPERTRFAFRGCFVEFAVGKHDLERTLASAQQIVSCWSFAVITAFTLKKYI